MFSVFAKLAILYNMKKKSFLYFIKRE